MRAVINAPIEVAAIRDFLFRAKADSSGQQDRSCEVSP